VPSRHRCAAGPVVQLGYRRRGACSVLCRGRQLGGCRRRRDVAIGKSLARSGFEEKYFHTGDVILNYVVGPANGPPLVFIHGQSVTWEEYTLIMPLLADRFQVYAVTLRGHG